LRDEKLGAAREAHVARPQTRHSVKPQARSSNPLENPGLGPWRPARRCRSRSCSGSSTELDWRPRRPAYIRLSTATATATCTSLWKRPGVPPVRRTA
jgi:hypothetical protein